jgi:oligopeptide/dipeptide ABC transporter ATP-binding protein
VSLLAVVDLLVSFPTADGVVQAVRGLSFDVEAGRTLGVVGESGSGKSVTALTLMGLNPGADISGSISFGGRDLLRLTPVELQALRGAEIAMIFQDPLSSLHPHYRVGWQIAEAIQAHTDASDREARERAIEMLRLAKIPQPDKRVDAYPHELSGGMRQRVMIAMALVLHPKLLIADEPTTALDATVQAQILDLLVTVQREVGMAMMVITHDLGVVASVADNVLVMYAGREAESSPVRDIFYDTHHPYSRGLLRSIPSATALGSRLEPIVGQPPSMINPPTGCAFHPRCPFAMTRCIDQTPPMMPIGSDAHRSACWLPVQFTGIGGEVDNARMEFARRNRDERVDSLPGVSSTLVEHV